MNTNNPSQYSSITTVGFIAVGKSYKSQNGKEGIVKSISYYRGETVQQFFDGIYPDYDRIVELQTNTKTISVKLSEIVIVKDKGLTQITAEKLNKLVEIGNKAAIQEYIRRYKKKP